MARRNPGSLAVAFLAVSLGSVGIAGCDRPMVTAAPSTASVAVTQPKPEPPPLIAATLAGDDEVVRSLLATGADPNQVYQTNTALTYAARDGLTTIAQALIAAGAEVNWIDGEGVTPLILAALKGHVEIAQLLMEHGADVTVIDQWHRTALDYALRRGEQDAIAEMIRQVSRPQGSPATAPQ